MLIFVFSFQNFRVIKELPSKGITGNLSYTITVVDKNKCQENKNYLINGNNVTIYLRFVKPDHCYDLSYNISTNESGIYISHTTSLRKGTCISLGIAMLSSECIEVNFTLPVEEYTLFVDGIKSNKTIRIEPTEEELTYCEKDDDCISVEDGCCGCGGTATIKKAINKGYYDYWKEKRTEECKGTGCYFNLNMGDHWTCSAKPKCVKNECTLVK